MRTRELDMDANEAGFKFRVEGKKQSAHYTWFRGEHCHFNPARDNMLGSHAVAQHVLAGWLPKTPRIGPQTKVTAFGSCFAENISQWLAQRDYSILTAETREGYEDPYVVRFGEGMVNSFVIRQQFEWAFEGKAPEEELWHGYQAEAYGYDEQVRQATRDLFDRTDVFIITLGLSEVWYDEVSGGVFWRAVPRNRYDPARHKFRVSTVAENKDNLEAIYRLIRHYRPEADIIFTLSPIPLVATFRDVSCITANSASKAILRAALDEFLRAVAQDGKAYYWPSYEIILDVFGNRWRWDRRHVKQPILDYVMTLFEAFWCQGSEPRYTLAEAWIRARAAAGNLPGTLRRALEKADSAAIADWVQRLQDAERLEDLRLIQERLEELTQSHAALASVLSDCRQGVESLEARQAD